HHDGLPFVRPSRTAMRRRIIDHRSLAFRILPLLAIDEAILAESLANPSLFPLLEVFLNRGEALESERGYIDAWLNRPGVRALFSPPKTMTAEWEETYSLDGFPVSKFLRILPLDEYQASSGTSISCL